MINNENAHRALIDAATCMSIRLTSDEAYFLIRVMQDKGWTFIQEAFTCPVCKMTSFNPNDMLESYCGNCHDWTGLRDRTR